MPPTEPQAKIATGRGHLCRVVDEVASLYGNMRTRARAAELHPFQVMTCSCRAPMIELGQRTSGCPRRQPAAGGHPRRRLARRED
jgi:hypothetical protein